MRRARAAVKKRMSAMRRAAVKKRAAAERHAAAKKHVAAKKRRLQVARVVVLRHGVTQANIERRYISRSDVPLSAGAHAALAPARRRLAAERPLAFTSDLIRCTATLARVCPRSAGRREHHRYTRNTGLASKVTDADCARGDWCGKAADKAAVRDARLRELNFGHWEGLTYEDLRSDALYCAWLDDMTAVIPPDGESWQQFAARTEAAWLDILRQASMHRPRRAAHRGATPIAVLVVTHGGVLRRLHSLAWPAASFWDIPAPTGGGYVLVAQRQGKHWRFLRTEPLTV